MRVGARARRTTTRTTSERSDRGRLPISWPYVRGQVDRDEDEDPHRVDEVPVQSDDLDGEVSVGVEAAMPRVVLEPQVHQQPHEHVEPVKSSDGEEQGSVYISSRRELLDLRDVLDGLKSEERGPQGEREEQPESQLPD